MTDQERTYLQTVREEVMLLYGTFGNIERREPEGTDQRQRARRGALAALALADGISQRLLGADIATEQAELEAGGYDLAALASAPPSAIED
jgi:hypothetical protein